MADIASVGGLTISEKCDVLLTYYLLVDGNSTRLPSGHQVAALTKTLPNSVYKGLQEFQTTGSIKDPQNPNRDELLALHCCPTS